MELTQFSFFKKFPAELVASLQQCTVLRSFKKGEIVIDQGALNDSLFFLKSGELGVYVDDGLVAKLSTPGDLIGEMSLISQQRSSATIKAYSDSELLQLKGEALHALTQKQGDTAKYNLYKIYSDILVQKLETTNHRAKHFEILVQKLQKAQEELEIMNASLEVKVQQRTAELAKSNDDLKQKNTELTATHDKLADLYQSRDITFQSLDNLLTYNLVPLRTTLQGLTVKDNAESLAFNRVEKEVTRAIHRLEPLTKSFNAEKSMKSQKVLLAEAVVKQHSIAKMALGGTGVELDIAQTEDEAKSKLDQNIYDIFMFNKEFLHLTEYARSKNDKTRFVFVTSDDIRDYVPVLLGHSLVPNVVSRDEEDRQFTIKNYVTTISKLASGNYFGLEKYISWGVEVKQTEVENSGQRSELIQKMDDYFANAGVRSANRSRCTVVAEELLMNAIYDAPKDQEGKPLYNHKSRTEVVELKEAHRPLFRYATDGVLMAISIEDPFGGLDVRTLFRYLEKCYTSTGSLNDGRADKGGGGRGLHQIIENSDLVVFNIDLGKRTEVIALLNTDQKSSGQRNPNLHFFKV